MSNLSPQAKKQIIDYSKKLCEDYLSFHKQFPKPFELPNDDYFVGMGVILDAPTPAPAPAPTQEQLTNQSRVIFNQLDRFLCNMSVLTQPQKMALYQLVGDGLQRFCRSPSQQAINTVETKLQKAMDIVFPFEERVSQNSNAMYAQKKARRQEDPSVAHVPMTRDGGGNETVLGLKINLGCLGTTN